MKDEQYDQLMSGLLATIDMLNALQQFLQKMEGPSFHRTVRNRRPRLLKAIR